jgi:hypothetical protein
MRTDAMRELVYALAVGLIAIVAVSQLIMLHRLEQIIEELRGDEQPTAPDPDYFGSIDER